MPEGLKCPGCFIGSLVYHTQLLWYYSLEFRMFHYLSTFSSYLFYLLSRQMSCYFFHINDDFSYCWLDQVYGQNSGLYYTMAGSRSFPVRLITKILESTSLSHV
jgi:hypothetical protein